MQVMERTVDAESAALGKAFEEHRERLLALVKRRMDPALAARLDPADVLAKAFLRAKGRCEQFSESGMPAYTRPTSCRSTRRDRRGRGGRYRPLLSVKA